MSLPVNAKPVGGVGAASVVTTPGVVVTGTPDVGGTDVETGGADVAGVVAGADEVGTTLVGTACVVDGVATGDVLQGLLLLLLGAGELCV